jgi:signal-transduction protein with cAMP-binding, CBS, and nucleotidyltransferase domain/rubredoxin
MTHWMCSHCGYYLQENLPPERCPGCNQVCIFNDVTCYRPECGGERNIDPLLVGATLGSLTKSNRVKSGPAVTVSSQDSIPITEIFRGLTETQIKTVRDLGELEYYEPGTLICKEGDEGLKLYIVEEGQVAVEPELGIANLAPLTTISRNAAFGWSSIVPPYKLTANVKAITRTTVLAIKREALLELIQADPRLGFVIMQNIASIIAAWFRRFEQEMAALIKQKR